MADVRGCGAADFTLKQGIETIVKRAVPEIQQVIDLTNHSAGVNPYYRGHNPETDRTLAESRL